MCHYHKMPFQVTAALILSAEKNLLPVIFEERYLKRLSEIPEKNRRLDSWFRVITCKSIMSQL